MEVTPEPFYNSLKKRYWGRRSYQRLDRSKANNTSRKVKSVKFARSQSTSRRFWRIKPVPKLRLKNIRSSANIHKLWTKFKNAYMHMMIKFSGKMWYSNNENVLVDHQRIPKVRKGGSSSVYAADEFESRLVYEIYKAVLETRQLSSKNNLD
ncbi:hypothetical protein ACOSP7_026220 [Xanthoceras sorbifolium]